MFKKQYSYLVVVLWIAMAFAGTAFAGTATLIATVDGLTTADFSLTALCGGTGFTNAITTDDFRVTVSGSYTITTLSHTMSTGDSFFMIYEGSFDASDTTINCIAPGTPLDTATVALTAGTKYIIMTASTGDVGTGTATHQFTGPGNICFPSCGGEEEVEEDDGLPRQVFFDGRINDFDSGNPVVLFGINEGNDKWGLEVYNSDSTGQLFYVTPAQIASVPECPTSNTLIYADETSGISIWRLPQQRVTDEGAVICPFQLNAPTGEPGKVYTIVFDTVYPSAYYESWEEFIGN